MAKGVLWSVVVALLLSLIGVSAFYGAEAWNTHRVLGSLTESTITEDQAIRRLGGASKAADALRRYLVLPGRSTEQRRQVYYLLGECRRCDLNVLLAGLSSGNAEEVQAAIDSLVRQEAFAAETAAAVRKQLVHSDWRVNLAAATYLVKAGAYSPEIERVLVSNMGRSSANLRVSEALRAAGVRSVPTLRRLLLSQDEDVRWRTVLFVRDTKELAVHLVPELRKLLDSGAFNIRLHALEGLGSAGPSARDDNGVVRATMGAVNDKHSRVRLKAIGLLGDFGSHSLPAVPTLKHIAEDSSEHMLLRQAAREALDKIKKAQEEK